MKNSLYLSFKSSKGEGPSYAFYYPNSMLIFDPFASCESLSSMLCSEGITASEDILDSLRF
jgi:hypothetical protein